MLEKYGLFQIIVNLLYTVVLSVVTKIITKVTETITIQKFMENCMFTNKNGKYRILLNEPYFVK